MLTILGAKNRFCDGITRRSFLTMGSLAVGGLSLPQLLRADAQNGGRRRHKSVIMIYLPGGPSSLDMYDPKPLAPVEIRGEFKPIPTRVSGIRICEQLPRMADIMDKVVPVRTITGGLDEHACHGCFTGWPAMSPQPAGNWPSFGSIIAQRQGAVDPTVPPFISLIAKMLHPPYNDPGPGFLGVQYSAFTGGGDGRGDMVLRNMTLNRLQDRRSLRSSLDRLRRDFDATGKAAGIDTFYQQAFDIISSKKLSDALDVEKEDPRVREMYGEGTPELIKGLNAAPRLPSHLLTARRLVEAGARCVTVAFGAYDWHEKIFPGMRGQLPYLDQGLSALVTDIHQRGLDKDVMVVAWGEMGRSPRVNTMAGRDHWPAVSCALLAGGGLRTGQTIGETTKGCEAVLNRPVHFREVLATIYHHMGIDVAHPPLQDLLGRPQYVLDHHEPIHELL